MCWHNVGSLAAEVHSLIGNVVAGGLFSTLQSAGAVGSGAAVVNGAVQAAIVAGGVVAGARKVFNMGK